MLSKKEAGLGRRSRLLIIDDDPLIRLLAHERLGREDFELHEAESGAEGIEVFAELRPDLVLLDVEMPKMNGFEVCKAIRETSLGQHVPILILTGREDLKAIEDAYGIGATDFVTKPLNWLILNHRVRYILRASESFQAVRAQQLRLDEVQQHALLGSWELDLETKELSGSSALRTLIDLGEGSVSIQKVLDHVHPEDRGPLTQACVAAIAHHEGFSLEHRITAIDGSPRVVHTQARVRTSIHAESVALEGFTQDITERRQTEDQVRLLAFSDSLTGLANRAAFKLHLDNSIHRARRSGHSMGVLYLDLDQFKRVNDTFGHSAGDSLLKTVAEVLRGCVRESDIVTRNSEGKPGALISRLGGDEFTILLESLSEPSDAGLVAQRVIDALATPTFVEGHELKTTASIGIAVWPNDGGDVESLLRSADSAMYHAKEQGRANYQFYRKEFNSQTLARLELESDLGKAIDRDRLSVHFQPKLDLATRRVSSCEALARWMDADRGMVAPSAFVALAESSGLISGLGEAVLRRACRGAKHLQRRLGQQLDLAVNLSAGQIKGDSLIPTIDEILAETGFDPAHLEFEVTESALIENEAHTVKVLEQLRERGCRISLDDFGTGYSSLSSLKRFPVQIVKIDRSFVSGIGVNRDDEAITSGILSLAQNLGMRVVAEGVETEEQFQFVEERGCDQVQGYLISHPIGLEEFEAFLEKQDAAGPYPKKPEEGRNHG